MNIANENNNSQMWCHFSQRVERTSMHRLMLAEAKDELIKTSFRTFDSKLPRDQAEELAESKAVRVLKKR